MIRRTDSKIDELRAEVHGIEKRVSVLSDRDLRRRHDDDTSATLRRQERRELTEEMAEIRGRVEKLDRRLWKLAFVVMVGSSAGAGTASVLANLIGG